MKKTNTLKKISTRKYTKTINQKKKYVIPFEQFEYTYFFFSNKRIYPFFNYKCTAQFA